MTSFTVVCPTCYREVDMLSPNVVAFQGLHFCDEDCCYAFQACAEELLPAYVQEGVKLGSLLR